MANDKHRINFAVFEDKHYIMLEDVVKLINDLDEGVAETLNSYFEYAKTVHEERKEKGCKVCGAQVHEA